MEEFFLLISQIVRIILKKSIQCNRWIFRSRFAQTIPNSPWSILWFWSRVHTRVKDPLGSTVWYRSVTRPHPSQEHVYHQKSTVPTIATERTHDFHWSPHCFLDTKPSSQDFIFFPFFSKILEWFNSKLPLVVFNLCLESGVKFHSWGLLVSIPSLGSPTGLGQSQILFASGSNITDSGLNASRSVMILRGAQFARDGEGKWFKTDWIAGSRSGHWEDSICHSEERDLRSFWMSLLTFSSVPLAQGEHGVVTWWLISRTRLNSLMTLSLKWDLCSLTCIEGMPNLE